MFLLCNTSVFSSFAITSLRREGWFLYFIFLLAVMWLLVFCVSFSKYHGMFCSVPLGHFLDILIYFFPGDSTVILFL